MLTSNWLTITTVHATYYCTTMMFFLMTLCATSLFSASEHVQRAQIFLRVRDTREHPADRSLRKQKLQSRLFFLHSLNSQLSACALLLHMNNCASLQLLACGEAYVRKTTTYRNDIRRNKQFHAMRWKCRAKESERIINCNTHSYSHYSKWLCFWHRFFSFLCSM